MRRRIGFVAACAVAVAVVAAAIVSYIEVKDQLRSQVDASLLAEATSLKQTQNLEAVRTNIFTLPPAAGGPAPYAQLVAPNGQRALVTGGLLLPASNQVRSAASGRSGVFLSDITVGGSHLRAITIPVSFTYAGGQTAAIQLARPLDGVDHILHTLRLILVLLCAGGVALAAVLGRLAATRVLAPLAEVTRTAEVIGETDDLSRRLNVHADDEVGQLAVQFNAMLETLQHSRSELDASVTAQRQLIADASHELRTPVTSLRTNIEVLLVSDHLDPEDRRQLLGDVVEQSDELTALVNDLIELARGDLRTDAKEDLRLDKIVEESVARSRRNAPDVIVRASLEPVAIEGVAERLHRVINNLLDNAARHSPPGGVIDVKVNREGIVVRDHGTGIDEQDLPYLFDRFYRGANSRASQGSGLGLAIVKQVTEQHGGTVSAENAPDGGAIFTIKLPVADTVESDHDHSEPEGRPDRVSAPLF
ncbi:MAG: sensor histidine kinase [Solirubrobacteraceae bacterium]